MLKGCGMRSHFNRLVLIFVVLSYGCIFHHNTPVRIVDSYYSAMQSGDFEKASKYLSYKDLEYLKKNHSDSLLLEFKKAYWNAIRWKIKTHDVKNDFAVVTLSVFSPDLGENIAKNIAHIVMSNNESFEGENSTNIRMAILKDLRQENYRFIEHEQKITLIKENDNWKILLNLENDFMMQQELLKALKLGSDNRLEEAIIKLEKILIFDQNNKIAKEYLNIIKRELREERPGSGFQ